MIALLQKRMVKCLILIYYTYNKEWKKVFFWVFLFIFHDKISDFLPVSY